MPPVEGVERFFDKNIAICDSLGPGVEKIHIGLRPKMLMVTGPLKNLGKINNPEQ
jgi:hypothetical protein